MATFFHHLLQITLDAVQTYGYAGIFLLGVSLFIYEPIAPDIFILGEIATGLRPLWVAFFALAGTTVGVALGYFSGRLLDRWGFKRVRSNKYFGKIEHWYQKYGAWIGFFGALSPLPLREISWFAGIFRLSFWKFLLAVFLGLLPRYFGETLLGKTILHWVQGP